ncbi:hypothetical protein GUJ93_ZPchr0012g20925 [Zizania palustris]|uniref:BLE2 protein n=1 Tax=Zizania palustris TaxID=103762 RepID=A0A8J5WQM0_ZIZPA|nr:hypothetical protein GUJ93_ZPchr0012g20925 [Zizania palustris]
MSNTTGGEHTQTQALPLALRVASGGKVKKVRSPEKVLNGFVWLVAVLERLGNATGTLAFTWATVILLGGYPTVLRSNDDFLYAIIIVFLEALSDQPIFRLTLIEFQFVALSLVSLGNFQIPAAVLRVVLASIRLHTQNYTANDGKDNNNKDPSSEKNLKTSMNIFYGIVLVQGILYIIACLVELFSSIPRRRLIRRVGFRGQLGVEYVNRYYAYALEKCMQGPMLAPTRISLVNFATDSIDSDSSKNRLYGVQVLHSLLKKDQLRTITISKLTTSTKTIATLFSMLAWTSHGDAETRLFAAKVTAELAGSLRIVHIPGAMQLVASLLDTDDYHLHKTRQHFLLIDIQDAQEQCSTIQQGEHNSSLLQYWKRMAIYCFIPADEPSTKDKQSCCLHTCWKRMTKLWSIPGEEPPSDKDCLPMQGLLILERLANFDAENCMEICKATSLITKVIDFTSYKNYQTSVRNEAQQVILAGLSLRMLRRLATTKGKPGVTLRQRILEHPFILSNLAEILGDRDSSHELKELAAEILKHLAMDRNASENIGRIRVIISSLMHEFLSRGGASSNTDSTHLLRKIAGQALAMLAMESVNNCLVMLMEPGYVFIRELTTMIHGDKYKYTAASLLVNMCEHARHKLSNSDLNDLCHTLREVLEGIMDAEGAELEVLISLSSQICRAIPEDFARELDHGQIKERFVERLVTVLHANMRPCAHCPSIRRVIVEHTIHLIECNSRYAKDFDKYRMVEALSMMERTPSMAENYRLLSGDAGFMEHRTPLYTLVARAKELMNREWV